MLKLKALFLILALLTPGCSPSQTQQLSFRNSVDNLFRTIERGVSQGLLIETQQCTHKEQKFLSECNGRAFTRDGSAMMFSTVCSTLKGVPCRVLILAPPMAKGTEKALSQF